MFDKLRDRNNQIIIFLGVLLLILIFRLFALTIVQGEKYKKMADEIRIKKIPISAPRGEIRDRYGRLLAGNKPSFTVQIMKNELIDEKINEVAIKIINILIKNDENYVDSFPIVIENGEYSYTFDKEIEDWLNGYGIKNTKSAEVVYNLLKEKFVIDSELSVYDAQRELQQKHGIYPPISVKSMKFIPQMQKESFLQRYNLDKEFAAQEAFQGLRDRFKIPQEYSDVDARKILMIRNELREQGYRQYQPVKIALNVSTKTVATIEEMSMELPGVNIEVEPIRYYPENNRASHILGYLGKISDSEREKFVKELGYSPNDLIGKDGLERVYEEKLKGKDGAKYVEVDVYGRLLNVLREEKPQKGENIYLSVDANLQKVAEEALIYALEQIQIGGTFKSQWGDYKYKAFPNATSGTVVALDVKTGEVLALANYPSFDPNLFATGISTKDWKMLQDSNPRDPLSPLPLYNVGTRAAVQPGSIFKMLTGLAAMEQGLDPTYQVYDDGYIPLGGKNFGCWLWNDYHRKHGWVDFYRALEVSCNYYFYDISTGWDYYKNQPLPISMNVDKLLEYAKIFGLDDPTGIEIGESAYGVPDPKKKLEDTKTILKRDLKRKAKIYFEEDVVKNKEALEKEIDTIVSWINENPSRGTLINRIGKMKVKEEQVETLVDLVKYSYFGQAKWTKGDTFNLSIGQGQHTYTPIQMANYIATLSNGGYKNQVSVVKRVGTEEKINQNESRGERVPLKDYDNLEHVKIGMKRVTQGDEGTGRTVFKKFPVTAVAKTGTAQRSGKIQPKDEAEYLRKNLKWIASYMDLSVVEERTEEIMRTNEEHTDEGQAMRKAIKELSNGKVTDAALDQPKDDYDNFAWFASYAPYDDPQIAVVSLVFQGGHGGYAAPIAREVIAEYMGLNKAYDKFDLKNTLTN